MSSGPPSQQSTPSHGFPQSTSSAQGPVPIQPYPTGSQPPAGQQNSAMASSYTQGAGPHTPQTAMPGPMNASGQASGQGPHLHAPQSAPPHPPAQYYYQQPPPPQGYAYPAYYSVGHDPIVLLIRPLIDADLSVHCSLSRPVRRIMPIRLRMTEVHRLTLDSPRTLHRLRIRPSRRRDNVRRSPVDTVGGARSVTGCP